jgi:hypothetical protein
MSANEPVSVIQKFLGAYIDASVLDDEKEVPLRIGQEIDVLRWVTVYQQHVGLRTFFEHA